MTIDELARAWGHETAQKEQDNYATDVAEQCALAIEAHARKMGEA